MPSYFPTSALLTKADFVHQKAFQLQVLCETIQGSSLFSFLLDKKFFCIWSSDTKKGL